MDGLDVPRRMPKHCVEDRDRHGNVRVYLRLPGRPKIRLHGVPWAPDFMADYAAAQSGALAEKPRNPRQTVPSSWKWLCQEYIGSSTFAQLEPVTQRRRRTILETTYDEPTKPGSPIRFADVPLAKLTAAAIAVLRDRKAAKKEAANARVKAVRAVFKWATLPEVKKADENPARDVPLLKVGGDGFHTWSIGEVDTFRERHPLGTRACLALALLLYVGGRRADIPALGPQHVSAGWLRYTQHKNRKRSPVTLEVPLLPDLAAAIAASPSRHLTFLVTEFGKPFTGNGFGNWFKDRCREAGLHHCSAHGLRKAGATFAAENGATERQLMAMFGWRSPAMPALYTRKAEQKRLAGAAMHLISTIPTVPLRLQLGQIPKKQSDIK